MVSHFAHQQAAKEAHLRLQQLSWQMRDRSLRLRQLANVSTQI
jgi:hypothetical protein